MSQQNSQKSLLGDDSSGKVLGDQRFSPPPRFSEEYLQLARTRTSDAYGGKKSEVPNFALVKHSGTLLARYSTLSMVTKKWKQCFWIIYGTNQIYFFDSKDDFEEWMFNPFISAKQRSELVKLGVDFLNDLKKNVVGHTATDVQVKDYTGQGMM